MIPYQPFLNLAPLTVVPDPVEKTEEFIRYMNRFYEEVALILNNRQIQFYTINISDVAEDVPNLPEYGAYLVAISGVAPTLPTGVWALCKSTDTIAGTGTTPLTSQSGSGIWTGISLTISTTANTFQVAHNLANTTGVFNISVFGTQVGTE